MYTLTLLIIFRALRAGSHDPQKYARPSEHRRGVWGPEDIVRVCVRANSSSVKRMHVERVCGTVKMISIQ